MKLFLSVVFLAFCLTKVSAAKIKEYKFHWANKCIDADIYNPAWMKPIKLETCDNDKHQFMIRLEDNNVAEIRRGNACLDYHGTIVWLYQCHGKKTYQAWHYNPETHQFRNEVYPKKCLAISKDQKTFLMEDCNESCLRQKLKLPDSADFSDYDRIA